MPATVLEDTTELSPNQILVLKSQSQTHKSSIAVKYYNDYTQLQRTAEFDFVYGLEPRNKEQQFALNLLMDDSIKLVSLAGASGVGKTLLSIAVGLEKIFGEEKYDRLVVTKPVQPVGKDIGFLPGSKEEKMDPWIAPIKDNLMYLLSTANQEKTSKRSRQPKKTASGGRKKRGKDFEEQQPTEEQKPKFTKESLLQHLFETGKIEVEAITFLRGRSIPNSFIIIDEAQNLTLHELKTIITRVGENTKIVLLGDIEQIDNPTLDIYTNGLTHVIEKFKDETIAGHITLIKGERSALATIASKIL
jgi:PhoH-like ATPase